MPKASPPGFRPLPSRRERALARELTEKAGALTPQPTHALAERRRIENARASSAIEQHYLTIAEVEATVRGEPSQRLGTEALRQEALAHIEVERLVDERVSKARRLRISVPL